MDAKNAFRLSYRPKQFALLLGALLLAFWVAMAAACLAQIAGALRPPARDESTASYARAESVMPNAGSRATA